jgi:hypothetical protein
MKFQFTDGTTQRLKTPVYFCPSGKIGPHFPPDQGRAGRNDETFFLVRDFERFDKGGRGVR